MFFGWRRWNPGGLDSAEEEGYMTVKGSVSKG